MPYSTKHVATLFKVSRETARSWANEFSRYLSPLASPPEGKHRLFTDEDISVLSLVAEMKKQGQTFQDIHASLQSGQRGQSAPMSPDEVQAIVEAGFESRAAVENEHLKRQIVQAKEQLSKLASVQAELEEMREQNIRLDAQLETSKEERQRLENKISDLTNRIEQLAREAGREYAKGFVDGMKEEGGRKGDSE